MYICTQTNGRVYRGTQEAEALSRTQPYNHPLLHIITKTDTHIPVFTPSCVSKGHMAGHTVTLTQAQTLVFRY